MIRKSGYRFPKRSCSNTNIERDDDSKKKSPRSGFASDRMGLHPCRHRPADRGTGILLDKMRARYRHLGLVFPAAAEIPDGPDQDRAGLGVDEKLWQLVLGHPFRIVGG